MCFETTEIYSLSFINEVSFPFYFNIIKIYCLIFGHLFLELFYNLFIYKLFF